ncbi:uncharacterized protein LOC112881599 isoform X2 [Panicum hallii]|uniref:uncharacterized protein LOC112881599 isoform X2 n=1 Tax=Panicum hallii TaxID=206008 RepID=UPI000DF4DBE3|nr:uncharacterized protein LOC112881599 isoform X2 [Panicum hallii]
MAAAQPSSSNSLAPPLRRRSRRLVFDRRYGWIFDEWTDPADQALSGGRGMFCAVTMARSLVNAAASSVLGKLANISNSYLCYKFSWKSSRIPQKFLSASIYALPSI